MASPHKALNRTRLPQPAVPFKPYQPQADLLYLVPTGDELHPGSQQLLEAAHTACAGVMAGPPASECVSGVWIKSCGVSLSALTRESLRE